MTVDFSFNFHRVIAAGAAESVPDISNTAVVWDLLETTTCGLILLATRSMSFEAAFWNPTAEEWVVVSSGDLVANIPQTIVFPYKGARVYIRKTTTSGSDLHLYCGIDSTTVASSGTSPTPPTPSPTSISKDFYWSDVAGGEVTIGTIADGTIVESAILDILDAFDGGTQIEIGINTAHAEVMLAVENDPSYVASYQTTSNVSYSTGVAVKLFFPAGTPTQGSGKVVVFLS